MVIITFLKKILQIYETTVRGLRSTFRLAGVFFILLSIPLMSVVIRLIFKIELKEIEVTYVEITPYRTHSQSHTFG